MLSSSARLPLASYGPTRQRGRFICMPVASLPSHMMGPPSMRGPTCQPGSPCARPPPEPAAGSYTTASMDAINQQAGALPEQQAVSIAAEVEQAVQVCE